MRFFAPETLASFSKCSLASLELARPLLYQEIETKSEKEINILSEGSRVSSTCETIKSVLSCVLSRPSFHVADLGPLPAHRTFPLSLKQTKPLSFLHL